MPIYEYQCDACTHKFEILQKISDAPLSDCPDCGESALRKLVSAAAFRLKGSGWYETDFKDKKSRKNVTGDDSKPADKGGSDSGNKESKKSPADSGAKTDAKTSSSTSAGADSG